MDFPHEKYVKTLLIPSDPTTSTKTFFFSFQFYVQNNNFNREDGKIVIITRKTYVCTFE